MRLNNITFPFGATTYSISPLAFNFGADGKVSLASFKQARDRGVSSKEFNLITKLVTKGATQAITKDKLSLSFSPVHLKGAAGNWSTEKLQASMKWKETNQVLLEVALHYRKASDASLRVMPINKLAGVESALDHKFIKKLMAEHGLTPQEFNGVKETSLQCILRTFKGNHKQTLQDALESYSTKHAEKESKPLSTVANSPRKPRVNKEKLALAMAQGKGE